MTLRVLLCCALLLTTRPLLAEEDEPQFKPVPLMQALPLPQDQVSLQREGRELCRYYFASEQKRPFIYPLIGPAGRSLTRMGHPHDPISHSHHNSIWISHQNVSGANFWEDRGSARIVHQHVAQLDDSDDASAVTSLNHWIGPDDKVLLKELRRITAQPLEEGQWLLTIDLQLKAAGDEVVLGKTAFGLLGVRMAKSLGVHDGGGRIRNSEGGVDEKGVFWKPARWVDYSGRITPDAVEGVTLLDHPANPNHPTVFHVRNDGWMGASLTHAAPLTIKSGNPLRLRYGLLIHAGLPTIEHLDRQWKDFSVTSLGDLTPKKK